MHEQYAAEQLDGGTEDERKRKWSVVDTTTNKVVASWSDTPITGMTEHEAAQTAKAANEGKARDELFALARRYEGEGDAEGAREARRQAMSYGQAW